MATYTGADKAIAFLFDMVRNIADDYTDAQAYTAGTYAIYNGTLYKCIQDIQTAGAFDPTKWIEVLIMDEVASGGGGGGGTTVIANPAGSATDTLNKLQVDTTIYSIPGGSSGGGIDYSGDEHEIGTWYGKILYQKTIKFTSSGGSSDTNVVMDATLKHGTNCYIVYMEGVYGYGYMNSDTSPSAPGAMNASTSPEPLGQATLHLPWYGGGTANAPMIYCYSDGIHFLKNGDTAAAKSVSLTVRYVKIAS